MKGLISLLTDFGLLDPFVGEMRAVIFSICPEARVVDVTHGVEPFNVRMGAFLLASATPYFPGGTVHVAVVDPSVGSARRPILVETKRALYVGPDNGLLIPAASREGIKHVYELTNRSLMRETISSTFHGRDIFAPVAAHLLCGVKPSDVGGELDDYVRLSFGEPRLDAKSLSCEVIHVDRFGNIVTNITKRQLDKLNRKRRFEVVVRRKRIPARWVKTYADLNEKELGLLFGSHGLLEIASRETSAARRLKVRVGDSLDIRGRPIS